jgi:hypothetical protein
MNSGLPEAEAGKSPLTRNRRRKNGFKYPDLCGSIFFFIMNGGFRQEKGIPISR